MPDNQSDYTLEPITLPTGNAADSASQAAGNGDDYSLQPITLPGFSGSSDLPSATAAPSAAPSPNAMSPEDLHNYFQSLPPGSTEYPTPDQLHKIVRWQQEQPVTASGVGKAAWNGFTGVLSDLWQGAKESASAFVNPDPGRAFATIPEAGERAYVNFLAEPARQAYNKIRDLAARYGNYVGGEPVDQQAADRDRRDVARYLENLAYKRSLSDAKGNIAPSWTRAGFDPYQHVADAASMLISPEGLATGGAKMIESMIADAAKKGVTLTFEDAAKIAAQKGLIDKGAGLLGATTSKAGRVSEKVGTFPEKAAGWIAEKVFGPGEVADKVAKAVGTTEALATPLAVVTGSGLAEIPAALKIADWAGQGAQGVGQFLTRLSETAKQGISPRLYQLAQDTKAPTWLRSTAYGLHNLGIGTMVDGMGGLAKSAAIGAAVGGGIGLLTGETPDDIAQQIGGGAGIGMFSHGVAGVTGANAKAINALQDLHDRARFITYLKGRGVSDDVIARIQDTPAALARTQLAAQTYALAPGKMDFNFVDGEAYKAIPGIDHSSAAFEQLDKQTGKPVVTINVDSPSNKVPHEITHAILRSLGADEETRLRIQQLLTPEQIQAQKETYAYLMLTGREDEKATTAARAEFKALPPEQKKALIDKQVSVEDARSTSGANWIYDEIAADAGEGELERLGYNLRQFIKPGWKQIGDSLREKFIGRLTGRSVYAPKEALFQSAKVYGPEMRRMLYDQMRKFFTPDPTNKSSFENAKKGVPVAKDKSGKGPKGNDPLPMELNPKTGLLENEWGARDPKYPDKFLPFSEKVLKKNENLRRQEVKKAFVEGKTTLPLGDKTPDVQPRTMPSGKVEITGTKLTDKLRSMFTFSNHMKAIADFAEKLMGTGKTMEGWYQLVEHSEESKLHGYDPGRGNVPVTWEELSPGNFYIDTKGNLLVRGWSAKAAQLKKSRWISENHTLLAPWGGDWQQFDKDLATYLKNHFSDLPGETGIGVEKKNSLNAFVIGDNKQFRDKNPARLQLRSKADKAGILRSLRVDRMGDFNPGKTEGLYYEYEKKPHNLSPQPERGPVDDQRASELFRRMRERVNSAPDIKPGNHPLPSRKDAEENYRNGQLNRAVGLAGRFSPQSDRSNIFENHEPSKNADENAREDENTRRAERYFDIGHNLKSSVWAWLDDRLQTGKGTAHSREFGPGRADSSFKGWYDPEENVVSFVSPDHEPVRSVDEIPDRVYRQIVNKFGKDVKFQFFPPESKERYSPQPDNKAKREEWQMTLAERLKSAENSLREKDKSDPEWVSGFLGNQKIYHRNAVKRALAEGKPVPTEVLEDYPHLKKKAELATPNEEREKPETAAVRIGQRIISASDHANAYHEAFKQGLIAARPKDNAGKDIESGFVTSKGRFVGRNEAAKMIGEVGPLTSEQLNRRYSPQPENKAKQDDLIGPGPVWYSALEKAIEAKMPGKAPVQMVRNIIDPAKSPGVKADEVKWTGLDDFLSKKDGVVTKQEVLDYLKQNAVKVVEKAPSVKGDGGEVDFDGGEVQEPDSYQVRELANDYYFDDALEELKEKYKDDPGADEEWLKEKAMDAAIDRAYEAEQETANTEYYDRTHGYRIVYSPSENRYEVQNPDGDHISSVSKYRDAVAEAQSDADESFGYDKEGTVHDRWQLAGDKKDYKELLFTLPEHPDGPEAFKEENHWDDGNPVAHVRFNTREIDGKKVLFLEEVQSDWHQQGLSDGYRHEFEPDTVDNIVFEKHPNGSYTVLYKNGKFAGYVPRQKVAEVMARYPGHDAVGAMKKEIEPKLLSQNQSNLAAAIPDAPWRSTWPEMVFRRMLRYAAEHGYDQIAWTTGDQQNKRYSLAKQVSRIEYEKIKPGIYELAAFGENGKSFEENGITAKRVAQLVGSELARKITESADARYKTLNEHSLELFGEPLFAIDDLSRAQVHEHYGAVKPLALTGDNLEINGSGMRKFYDERLPSYANKLGKKFGARVGEAALPTKNGKWKGEVYNSETGETLGMHDGPVSAAEQQTALNNQGVPTALRDTYVVDDAEKIHAMPVTPEMRKSVVSEGMPRYSPQPEKAPETMNKAKRAIQKDQTKLPAFKKWAGKAKLVRAGETHDFKPGKPVVIEGFHGTTHDFNEVDIDRTNPESDFGKGFYVSNTAEDVEHNYAGVGPDLTSRIENRAEEILNEYDPYPKYGTPEYEQAMREAKAKAKQELSSHEGATMKVFVRLENPFVVDSKGGEYWDYGYNEDTGEETGKITDLLNATRKVADRYHDTNLDKLPEIYEGNAGDLLKELKNSDAIAYATDENGRLMSSQMIAEILQEMGYDGVIDKTVDEKFGSQRRVGKNMRGMGPDTFHVIAYPNASIKSATGNKGSFDRGNPDIRYSPMSEAPKTESPEFKKWFGSSPVRKPDGKPLVVYHGTAREFYEFDHDVAWFADDKGDAADYRDAAVLRDADVELPEDVYDINELGRQGVDHLLEEEGIDPREKGRIVSAYLAPKKMFDMRNELQDGHRANVSDVEDAWNKLHEKGIVSESWNDIDEEGRYELQEEFEGKAWWKFAEENGIYPWLKENGYDAVKIIDVNMAGQSHVAYGVFDPSRIKSTENSGKFDENKPDIRYSPQAPEFKDALWHGTPSGDLRGGKNGLHVGTYKAAEQALGARIGIPATGTWDGTREYGKTLIAGRKTLEKIDPNEYNKTGFNASAPEEDYYPNGKATYGDGTLIAMNAKPNIIPVRIKGRMTNTPQRAYNDTRANGLMRGMLTRGTAKSGFYYLNDGEDSGSISAVVPNGSHLEILEPKPKEQGEARH